MRKQVFLGVIAVSLFLMNPLWAQKEVGDVEVETRTVEFDDGTSYEYGVIWDNPGRRPRYNVGLGVHFGSSGGNSELFDENLAINILLRGEYFLSEDFLINARFAGSIAPVFGSTTAPYSEFQANVNYRLFSSTFTRDSRVKISDQKTIGNVRIRHFVKQSRRYGQALYAEGGIFHLGMESRYPVRPRENAPGDNRTLRLNGQNLSGIQLGVRYSLFQSLGFLLDGYKREDSGNWDWYLRGMLAVRDAREFNGDYDEDLYRDVELNRLGWRVGLTNTRYFLPHLSGTFYLETGHNPAYIVDDEDNSNSLYVGLGYTLNFQPMNY